MTTKDHLGDEDTKLDWSKPKPPGPGSTVGERVEYSIAEAMRRFFALFDDPLAEMLSWPLRIFAKVLEKSAAKYMKPILRAAKKHIPEGDPFRDLLEQLENPTGEAAAGLLLGIGSSAGAAGLMSVFEPIFEMWRQNAYLGTPSQLPDPGTILQLHARGHLPREKLEEWIQRKGFDKALADPIWDVLRMRPSVGDMGAMAQRGDLPRADYISELMARGMTEEEAERAEKLLHIIPGPTDLILMAVREAFSPEFVSQYQLLSDFPAEFATWAEKVGLDREWAERYWSSHWRLPSTTQAYEMVHRDVITPEELTDLLRAADVSPWWREKLVEISYRPFTRVDTRRMYELGVLTEQGILRSYLDIGYDPEKAQSMTEFTVRYAQEGEREATKTDIITALKSGAITATEATGYLQDIGYSILYTEVYVSKAVYQVEQAKAKEEEEELVDDTDTEREETKSDIIGAYRDDVYTEAESQAGLVAIGYAPSVAQVMLARVDLKRAQELAREEIRTVETLYVSRRIELPEVHTRLGVLALPAAQIDSLTELWDIARLRRTERPSAAKLLQFFERGVIPEERLREELAGHGLADDYIDWHMQHISLEILEREKAEQERLAREQERELLSEFRDVRKVALNELDVQIQEYRVYVAELKVLVFHIEEKAQLTAIKQEVAETQTEIARLQLTKLEHPVVLPRE